MNIGTVLAILLVILALTAGILLGNTDVTSPAIALNEIKQHSPGAATSNIITNQIFSVFLGVLVTGLVAGIAGMAFVLVREWLENRQKGDWEPGPNAGFRRRGQRQQPMMSRDEMFQLALLNALTQGQAQRYLPQVQSPPDEQDTAQF